MMLPKIAILLFLFLLFDFKVECHPNGNRKRTKEEQQRNVDVEIDASGQTSAKSRTRKTSPAILSKLSDLSPGEDILWLRGRQDQTDLPTLDAIKILMPDEISKISIFNISYPSNRRRKKTHKCGFSNAVVVFDLDGELMLASIDNFFDKSAINELKSFAVGEGKWSYSKLHPSRWNPTDPTKNNGFPGYRAESPSTTAYHIKKCLKVIVAIFDKKTKITNLKADETILGLVAPLNDPQKFKGLKWLDSQRLPHTDILFDMGFDPNTSVFAQSYASVLSLTNEWNSSGTGLWVENETGYSLLKTRYQHSAVFDRINPELRSHSHPEINLYREIPDPVPQHLVEHAWCKMSVLAELRFNRLALYDGRRLHQVYVKLEDANRLTGNPNTGRLTVNSFFWTSFT